MTREEDQHAQRLGYWLRLVRERLEITQSAAAEAAGLSRGSGSTVSLWERGQRPISVVQLRRLARFYGVPASLFLNPPKTDEERLEDALSDAARLEREDWAAEQDQGRGADDEPGDGRRKPLQ
ncbi:MAG TPA: helix-turn-helix transcriptional regulator [Candidatus Limnocylindrales bacterium]|nr:helix-turn-helix transcriptional regulator [Candidatus Limnocylindrales bacterium]